MEVQRHRISPRAFALALQKDINILSITPIGPKGRIVEHDVLRTFEKECLSEKEQNPEVNLDECK